ncbi:MAG: AN1-type zinc finger domain-containing protein [Candidatus Thorarchaeota archaeon]
MTYCEFCGEQIGYLPFTCKYCGGTFCKKHRLPENHECTFELKHVSVVSTTPSQSRKGDQSTVMKKTTSREYSEQGPKSLKKYLKRQEKERRKTFRSYTTDQKPLFGKTNFLGTKILFALIIVLSIIALSIYAYPQFIFLSLHGLVFEYTYYTILTSLFISQVDFFGFFFLIIMLFFLYFMARSIELTQGSKFLIKLYIICGLFSALFYVLLRVSLIAIFPIYNYAIYVGFAWGGILGILSYSLFPLMNRQITALMYFLPIRLKGRTFLIIIILFRLIPGLLFAFYDIISLLFYLPDLGGILGSYLIFRYKFKR